MHRLLCLILLFSSQLIFASSDSNIIRLATTTSVENSGLLNFLLPKFKQKNPHYQIDIAVVGSGKALRMARTGTADLVWVHSPKAAKKFIEQGYAKRSYLVMHNDFVIVGPLDDAAGVAKANNVYEGLKMIARTKAKFISRADDSGTNQTEISLWEESGSQTYMQDWYIESGVGQAASLKIAEKENAYLLIDRATFTVKSKGILKILLEDDARLHNPYDLIAVDPLVVSDVNYEGAKSLIDWLMSTEGQQAIGKFSHRGVPLYQPISMGEH